MTLRLLSEKTLWFISVILLQACLAAPASAATSVSRSGITWTFDKNYTTGQFANGDHWVVGPVKIVGITPKDPNLSDTTDLHGSVVNPQPDTCSPYTQSWDSRVGGGTTYDRTRNVARQLPLTLAAGNSLVSVNSFASPNGNGLHMADAAVLTVLASAPPAGSFRPPYSGTNKTIPGNVADLNLTIFRSLAPVSGAPAFSSFDGQFDQPFLDIIGQWPNSSVKAANGGPHYGRDVAHQVGTAILSLNLNYSAEQKKSLLIKIVQRGIDTYGLAKAGMVWWPNGGHNTGRKFPMLIAAKALGHADMLEWSDAQKHFIFHDDMQHFVINQTDVTTPRTTSDSQPYTTAMIGLPEWASNPLTERTKTGSEWIKPYRINNGSVNTGQVLAAEIMGLRAAWNWEPLFNYINNRYWPKEGTVASTSVPIPSFHRAMWNAYRNSKPSQIDVDNTTTSGVWQNSAITAQTGKFTCSFDMVPSAARIDGVTGLSLTTADDYSDLAAAVRFAPTGVIDARNGGSFTAASTLTYSAGVKYRVVMTVDVVAHTYSATVTPQNGSTVTIAQNYAFRTEQKAVTKLANLGFLATSGAHAVLNIAVTTTSSTTSPAPAPVTEPAPAPAPVTDPTPAPSVSTSVLRVNAGAGQYTDKAGNTWAADYGVVSGNLVRSCTTAIGNTTDPTLFQSQRYDNPKSGALLVYNFPMANGSYKVRLSFAEIALTSVGARVFDVKIEDKLVIDDLDIVSRAGGAHKALVIEVPVTVADGNLNIWFYRGVNDPCVSAIEVIKP